MKSFNYLLTITTLDGAAQIHQLTSLIEVSRALRANPHKQFVLIRDEKLIAVFEADSDWAYVTKSVVIDEWDVLEAIENQPFAQFI